MGKDWGVGGGGVTTLTAIGLLVEMETSSS